MKQFLTCSARWAFVAALFLPAFGTGLRAQSFVAVDTALVMSDGVKIDALYIMPVSEPPASGYPAIVFVHGLGGDKEETLGYALDFAGRGYVAVNYSVRGQGNSEGYLDFFTSEKLKGDLKAFIDLAKALPNTNDDRVGIAGVSQGGIHAWSAAAYHLGARAVISIVANGRFEEVFLENNAMNWLFTRSVQFVGPAQVRFDPILKDSLNVAAATGNTDFVKSLLTTHSTTPLESAVTAPVLMIFSYHDEFFNPSAAFRQFAGISAPKRLIAYAAGHEFPPLSAQSNFAWNTMYRWFDYWLMDNALEHNVANADSAVCIYDGGTGEGTFLAAHRTDYLVETAIPELPRGITKETFYFDGTALAAAAPTASESKTFEYTVNNFLQYTPLIFRSQPFESDKTVATIPIRARVKTDGSAPAYQVNLVLYDVSSSLLVRKPIARGHYQVVDNAAGAVDELTFQLTAAFHTIPKGHMLEARIHGGVSLIPDQTLDFGNIPYAPIASSANTLYTGGENASSFTVTFLDKSVLATENTPTAANGLTLWNYPNPVEASSGSGTTVSFIASSPEARLEVVDNLGRKVALLAEGVSNPGMHSVPFMASGLPAGVYHAILTDGSKRAIRTIVVK